MLKRKTVINIKDSYKIWNLAEMIHTLDYELAPEILRRGYLSLIIEWYIHNIIYYITLPFIKCKWFNRLNERAKHVDLEERYK